MSDATAFIREQRHNRRASVVILAGTFALLFIVANLVAGILGAYTTQGECTTVRGAGGVPEQSCTTEFQLNWVALAVVAVVVLGYLIIAWLGSSRAALTIVQAKPADGPEYAELRALVEQMSIASGIPVPKTYVVEDTAPNAFATGRNPNHAAITVTTGLLAIMSRRELRGVLAHEMAHIRNRDIAVTTLAVLAVGAIAVIGDIALRVGIFGGMGRRSNNNNGAALFLVLSLAIYLIAVPAGLLLKASLSRKRESLADATAVELTREPAGIRSALEKLEANTAVVQHPSAATAHLWIESPLERGHGQGMRGSFGRLFDTHPPLTERIALLRSIEGLDPEGRGPNDPFPPPVAV
jgi:heat shock protein HtpX